MKKTMAVLLTGMMMVSVFLGGCGSGGQTASEPMGSGTEAQQESAKQDEIQENPEKAEESAVLDEPYVLVRETDAKSGNVTEYAYDENGDKVSKTVKRPDETMLWEYTTEYREDGSKVVTQSQGILVETGETFSTDVNEYEYSPEGLLLRETLYAGEEVLMEIRYEYDGNGNLIRQNGTSRDTTKEFAYDEAGNMVKETTFDSEGNVRYTYTYEYDQDGKEILKHKFNALGEETESFELFQWNYEYDGEGRVIEEWKEGTEHGGISEHYEYEYDEYGNVCKKKDLGTDTTYEYAPLSACVW